MRLVALTFTALLIASAVMAAEGDVPRFNTGLEEGVSTVAPLNPTVTGAPSKVLDADNFPYGSSRQSLITNGVLWDPAIVKVGSNYYLWSHHGWPTAGCPKESDSTQQAGDNMLVYRSPYPDQVWSPAKSSTNTTTGFYPTGCSSSSCGGSVNPSELLASLGSDYNANNTCTPANHTGAGGVARVGTTSSYLVILNDNDGDAFQVDPNTGKTVWTEGRDGSMGYDFKCGSSNCHEPDSPGCAYPTIASSDCGEWQSCPSCGETSPTCKNSNNTDAYFSHYAFWRLIGEFTDGKSFNATDDFVLFNSRNLDRTFYTVVPFTIPGDNSAVGFFVSSAKAGWCENFRDARLHVGYVTTGKQVYLKIGGSYQNVTGTNLQTIPDDIKPSQPGVLGHVETMTVAGQKFGVVFEHVVKGGTVVANDGSPDCGSIGWGGPGSSPGVHSELRYRAFKLSGRNWGGWLGNDTIDLGAKSASQTLWTDGRAYTRDGPTGMSYPTVLLEGGAGRLYYTRDSECQGSIGTEIFHVGLEDNAAWDSGFRESASTTAPIVFFPDDITVSYPNTNVPPNVVFTPFVGTFGNATERADRKWSVDNTAYAATPGGSYSCVHGFKDEQLKRIVVSLGGLDPNTSYKVYLDYAVDGNLSNGIDGLVANGGGGAVEFSENVSGVDGTHEVIEVVGSSTYEVRRARLITRTSTSTGTLGNLTVDNAYSGDPQFEVSRFCGFYIEKE